MDILSVMLWIGVVLAIVFVVDYYRTEQQIQRNEYEMQQWINNMADHYRKLGKGKAQ